MKIAVIDDYQDAFRKLNCFSRLKDHEVVLFHDTEKDPVRLAARLKDAAAVILTQQRSPFPRALIEKLPGTLKLITQTGRNTNHIDVAACTEKGIVVAAAGGGTSYATAELTWGLIIASLRSIPHEVEQLSRACGRPRSAPDCTARRSAFMRLARSAVAWHRSARHSA